MTSSGLVVDGSDVPVFVVNMDSRPDRWDAVQQRLSARGLQSERISALTGEAATDIGYRSAVPEHEHAEWRLGPGALGCAASHLELYRRIASASSPGAVIMEDDVVLGENFLARARQALERRSPETAVLSLGWLFAEKTARGRVLDVTHRLLGRGERDRLAVEPFGFGTHCYWVSREFAAIAPELMTPIYAPIDAMLRAVTHYSSWQAEVHWPSLATQDGTPSDIR